MYGDDWFIQHQLCQNRFGSPGYYLVKHTDIVLILSACGKLYWEFFMV